MDISIICISLAIHQRDISPLLSVFFFLFLFLEQSIRGHGISVIGRENYYIGIVLRKTIIKIYLISRLFHHSG